MPDLQTVLFDYHGLPVYIRLGQSTETPEIARYMGPRGFLKRPSSASSIPRRLASIRRRATTTRASRRRCVAEYARAWHEKHDPEARKRTLAEKKVYSGDSWDDLRPHISTFLAAVKSRKPNVENAVFGNHAAIACHMANHSYLRDERVFFDHATHALKS